MPSHSHSQFCHQLPFPWDSHGIPIPIGNLIPMVISTAELVEHIVVRPWRPGLTSLVAAVMSCGWEGNRRSGVEPWPLCHRLKWFIPDAYLQWLGDLETGDQWICRDPRQLSSS